MMWLLGHHRYASFIHPDFKILLLLAMNGTFVFLIAICSKASKQHENCDHEHHSPFRQWITTGWVLLPIWFAVAGFSGQSLNADAFAKRRIQPKPLQTDTPSANSTSPETAVEQQPFLLEDHMQLSTPQNKPLTDSTENRVTLLDIAMSQDSMLGKEVVTLGRVYRADDLPKGHIAIFRFAITCCAADAQPVGMLIKTEAKDLPESDQWVEIRGKLELHQIEGQDQFVIIAKDITNIEAPKMPYLQAQ
jgi:uncharacterized repeat protein (TIGR03943 family)